MRTLYVTRMKILWLAHVHPPVAEGEKCAVPIGGHNGAGHVQDTYTDGRGLQPLLDTDHGQEIRPNDVKTRP